MKKKDYLKMYQEGGAVPGPAQGPQGPPPVDPEKMLQEVVESQNPQLALEFCNMLAGGAPEGAAPPEQAPAPAPMGRYGMKVPKIKL